MLCASPSKPETRLRIQGRQAWMVRWSSLTFLMSIFFHRWMLKVCVMLRLDLHTMSADHPWSSLWVSWSALTLWLSIYGILRGVWCTYTLKDQIIVSKPWKCMENSTILPANVGGEGILFPWFGGLFVFI